MNSSHVAEVEGLSEPEFTPHANTADIPTSGDFSSVFGGMVVELRFNQTKGICI